MSTHFIAYPVTAGMGLRESINAMLDHVAWHSSMGYPADVLHAANYRAMLRDFGPDGDYGTVGLVEEHYEGMSYMLRLVGRIPAGFSEHLAYLVETLLTLCNDYPVYDEETYYEVEKERTIESIEMVRSELDPSAEDILSAMHDLDIQPVQESDGSVYISEADFEAARALADSLTVEV